MEKIDRLGWAAGISFLSYGVRAGIRTNDPEIMGRLLERLPPLWKPASSPVVDVLYSVRVGGEGPRSNVRRFNLLYGNLEKLARTLDLDEVLERLESDLQMYVAEFSPSRIFVHAGAVGWRGKAIVIPGLSYSGKSTLVAELVRAGATYYSDEYAVFDSRGRVHPYPRPLGIRENPVELPKKYSVERLGGSAGAKPLPLGLVVSTYYTPGAKWRPRLLTPGQGALALLKNTVPARRQPEASLNALQQAMIKASVIKSNRGEAREAVKHILNFLDNQASTR